MQRSEISPTNQSDDELTVLTYNVWTGNSSENMDRLCDYISNSGTDIICLQEVTKTFYEKLLTENSPLLKDYEILNPPAADFWDIIRSDGELMLVKKKYQPTFFNPISLEKTSQNRFFSYGVIDIKGLKIGFATAHIESVFYRKEYTELKARQINQICQTMEDMKVDAYILSGDINLTGGDQLVAENQVIEKLELIDVWQKLKTTTDDSSDEKFKNEDATWDGSHNPNISDKTEFQRPDRIYMKFFKPSIEPLDIERINANWSDHYGLKAKFKVTKP